MPGYVNLRRLMCTITGFATSCPWAAMRMHTGREDRARVEEPRGTTTQEEATTTSAAADAALRRGIEGEAWGIETRGEYDR